MEESEIHRRPSRDVRKKRAYSPRERAWPARTPQLNPARRTRLTSIFDRVTNGLRGMPSWKSQFNEEQRMAVAAYVLSADFGSLMSRPEGGTTRVASRSREPEMSRLSGDHDCGGPLRFDLLRHWLARQGRSRLRDTGWNAQMAGASRGPRRPCPFDCFGPASSRQETISSSMAPIVPLPARRAAGEMPAEWSVDSAARVMLVLCTGLDGPLLSRRLMELCSTADTRELIAPLRGLRSIHSPALHVVRAREAACAPACVRWFEAVAHGSLIRRNNLDGIHLEPDGAGKRCSSGSALHPIQGFPIGAAMPTLARTLLDYVQERWAAGRASDARGSGARSGPSPTSLRSPCC